MKRRLLVPVLLLLFCMMMPVVSAEDGDSSPAIWEKCSSWAEEELTAAYSSSLIPEELLGTDMTVPATREEFAAISVCVYEVLTGNEISMPEENPFSDCSSDAALKAYAAGITKGVGDGTAFDPEGLVTREQAATMLVRTAKGSMGISVMWYTVPDPFDDDDAISDWAKNSVYCMASKGIILGSGGKFMPAPRGEEDQENGYGLLTREQALLLGCRLYTFFCDYSTTLTELPEEEWYGYQYLRSLDEKYCTVYDLLLESMESCEEVSGLLEYHLTGEELLMIYECCLSDNPEIFWISSYSYAINREELVLRFIPESLYSMEELDRMRDELETAAAECLTGIYDSMSEAERELYIHDVIVTGAVYDTAVSKGSHTLYANLVGHSSVCDGYAKAFQYLLKKAGIQSVFVGGIETVSGDRTEHAWTIVRVEGEYWQVDVTWDDPVVRGITDTVSGYENHDYYNLTDEEMYTTHVPDIDLGYLLPECGVALYTKNAA